MKPRHLHALLLYLYIYSYVRTNHARYVHMPLFFTNTSCLLICSCIATLVLLYDTLPSPGDMPVSNNNAAHFGFLDYQRRKVCVMTHDA